VVPADKQQGCLTLKDERQRTEESECSERRLLLLLLLLLLLSLLLLWEISLLL